MRQPPHPPRTQAGRNLRHLIGMHGLRQGQLAAIIAISPTSLTNILTGRTEPSLGTVRRAAHAFGITIDELYADLPRCLRGAVVAFESAPVRALHPDEDMQPTMNGG